MLPFVDAHDVVLPCDIRAAWERVQAATRRTSMLGPKGFPERELDAPRRMRLAGEHPFARYELTFELEETEPGRTRVRAVTHALFKPGLGKVYGGLVVGSGMHAVVVRRLLRKL